MPRRPSVTMAELEDLVDGASAAYGSRMQDCADRILQGYCQKPERLAAKVLALNSLIGAASALLGAISQKLYLDELKVETEQQMKDKASATTAAKAQG